MVGGLQRVERGVGHRFQLGFVVVKQKQVGVGNLMDKAKIMAGNEQAACRFFLHAPYRFNEAAARFLVQSVGWLVQNENGIAAGETGQHFRHLLLSG